MIFSLSLRLKKAFLGFSAPVRTARKRGAKKGRINILVNVHYSPSLLDKAGIEWSRRDEYASGRTTVRVALRLLQIMPKWHRDLVPYAERETLAVETLRLLNGRGGRL